MEKIPEVTIKALAGHIYASMAAVLQYHDSDFFDAGYPQHRGCLLVAIGSWLQQLQPAQIDLLQSQGAHTVTPFSRWCPHDVKIIDATIDVPLAMTALQYVLQDFVRNYVGCAPLLAIHEAGKYLEKGGHRTAWPHRPRH